MGGSEPKQFVEIAGRSILEHTIRAFHAHAGIDEIAIVAPPAHAARVRAIAAPYVKVRRVLAGGSERHESSLAAIRAYSADEAAAPGSIRLLIHDAVRPLVSQRVISDCLAALDTCAAVDVAIACTDTIVEVDADGHICRIPPRARLRHVQTPQGFHFATIAEAYRRGLADPDFTTTDDCGVVYRYMPETPIRVIAGDTTNIKLTYRSDLVLAARLLGEADGGTAGRDDILARQ